MKKLLTVSVVLATTFWIVAAHQSKDEPSVYVKLARSLESFGAVFREVNTSYVDEVDPQDLVEVGIGAMLKHLDPYSTYMKVDESEELDMLSTGAYVGFGISVGRRDSLLTIIDIRVDGPAGKAGVRIGDRLISVNSVRTDTMAPQGLRKFSKGLPGSVARLRFLRDGRRDTITVDIARAELSVESIGHIEVLPNNIGYVRLSRFAKGTGLALRKSLSSLQEHIQLTGFILDLRDNPGGLLDAAVDVVELFVPRSSAIVSTRGRDDEERRSYTSNEDPIEPTLPLVVIINERSASASEIVAGAIQDLDRGIIIGKRSFGKGLVQTMATLPNDATLKLTTSRYYTPSGRCIQRIDYRNRRLGVQQPNTAVAGLEEIPRVFKTKNGRALTDLNGIAPDSTVVDSTMPTALAYLDAQNVFSRFATVFTSSIDSLPSQFSVDKGLIERFLQYVDSLPVEKRSPLLADLEKARQNATSSGWSASALKGLEQAERSLEKELGKVLRQYQPLVVERLEQEIRTRFGSDSIRETRALSADPSVLAARAILGSGRYQMILASQVPSDQ